MENAADALKIAGGIFLALLTISLLVFMVANISSIGEKETSIKEAKQIKAWNAEWEAYNKKVLYGADVLTVSNKAESEKDYNDLSDKTKEMFKEKYETICKIVLGE